MMQHASLVAAGIGANHCETLCGKRDATPAELVPALARIGEKMADRLADDMADLPGAEVRSVRCVGVETVAETALDRQIGPLAANALYSLSGGHRLLASIEARAVLMHLDRTFGGNGDVEETLPAALPTSADFLAEEMERCLTGGLQKAIGAGCDLRAAGRNTRYAMVSPFPPGCELAVLTLEITELNAQPWKAVFATRMEALPVLLARPGMSAPDATRAARGDDGDPRGGAHPLDKPFAEIPLPIEARLIDMAIPISRLARLEPGMVIPVAVARNVPLRVGDAIVARGTVGELDDQIALQITQTQIS